MDNLKDDLLQFFQSRPTMGHPKFYELLIEMADLHSRKNHDYAGEDPLSNLKACSEYGIDPIDGIIARITDKDSRFKNWYRERNLQVAESMHDTLIDRAVYTLLLTILLEEIA